MGQDQTMKPLLPSQVRIEDPLWSRVERLVREVVIPYQYEALHDRIPNVDPSYAIRNFRIAAGLEEGEFGGMVFQDSDVAKWLEAVGYSLMTHPDPELEKRADEVIDLVAMAQQPDGYLNTYFTIKEPGNRWTNLLDCHELYCAGHMIEAAVAYYQATGKRKLLDVVCRFVDHIDTVFGDEEGKLPGYDGHQEIELALVKLYGVTGDEKHLRLAQYFIDRRGTEPHFFLQEWERRGGISHWGGVKRPVHLPYHQAHKPVREQDVAVGHAVRAVYMYTAMADLARLTGDEALLAACDRLWSNIVTRQMYITGGIGSTHHGEAFSFDYDLPNDTVYAETCASIGLIFFANRMLQLRARGEYADVMERALYNTVLAGMAQDGRHYFYVNPLEVWPAASRGNPGKHHVRPVRPGWFGCACCPPNVARLIASLGQYAYGATEDTAYIHLYVGGETDIRVAGQDVKLHVSSDYPWDGRISIKVTGVQGHRFRLAVRVPGWSQAARLQVNGQELALDELLSDGYAYIDREWNDGDEAVLDLDMSACRVYAHPSVRADAGKVAIMRGPLVYCVEEADNGAPITSLMLPADAHLSSRFDTQLLGGCTVIEADGWRDDSETWGEALYRTAAKKRQPAKLTFIPYYLWANRGEGEMSVWVREI
jgi:hypothetical protein